MSAPSKSNYPTYYPSPAERRDRQTRQAQIESARGQVGKAVQIARYSRHDARTYKDARFAAISTEAMQDARYWRAVVDTLEQLENKL